MTEMSVAGETFNVLVEGDAGKEVLMISNPLGVNLHLWDSQMPALLEHFRVVRYDSRGHGASVADEGPYSIAGFGKDALAIMDVLSIEKAHWLGLSLGAIVGQWLLVHAGRRIGRAVLANTAALIPGPELWNERIRSARETGMEGVAAIVAERWFSKTFRETNEDAVEAVMAMLRETPLQGYTAACAALRDMDQREEIRAITNKVLVIGGRHDVSTPPAMGALVASSIEGAKLVTLETSHMSNIEAAESFNVAVVDFLTAVDSPPRKTFPRRRAPARQAPVQKAPAPAAPAKKAAVKKAAVKKAPVKKAAPKKAAVKKAAPKKAAPKKAAVKKALAKKAAMQKAVVKKAPVKKAATKKAPAKKAAVTKAPVKSAPVKKAPVKKTTTKKAAIKKPAAKTTANRRSVAAKSVAKKAPRKGKT